MLIEYKLGSFEAKLGAKIASVTSIHNVTCFDYEVMISPLFRWPNSVCHYRHNFEVIENRFVNLSENDRKPVTCIFQITTQWHRAVSKIAYRNVPVFIIYIHYQIYHELPFSFINE